MIFLLLLLMLFGKEILPLGAAPCAAIAAPPPPAPHLAVQRTEM